MFKRARAWQKGIDSDDEDSGSSGSEDEYDLEEPRRKKRKIHDNEDEEEIDYNALLYEGELREVFEEKTAKREQKLLKEKGDRKRLLEQAKKQQQIDEDEDDDDDDDDGEGDEEEEDEEEIEEDGDEDEDDEDDDEDEDDDAVLARAKAELAELLKEQEEMGIKTYSCPICPEKQLNSQQDLDMHKKSKVRL